MVMDKLKEYASCSVNFFKKGFLKSPFYGAYLRGNIPKEVFTPPLYDVLTIHTEDALTKGNLQYQGVVYNFDLDTFFETYDEVTQVHHYLHSFDWLNLLYQSNSFNSRALARHLILRWFQQRYKPDSYINSPVLTGLRLVNLIKLYDFYAQTARDDFKQYVLRGIINQLNHASISVSLCSSIHETLSCLAGVLYGQIFFKQSSKKIFKTLDRINGVCVEMLSSLAENKTNIRTLIRDYKLLYAINKTFNWHQFDADNNTVVETLKKLEKIISFFHFQGGFFFTNEPPQVSLEVEQILRKSPHIDSTQSYMGFEKLQSYNTLAVVNVQSEEVFENEEELPPAPFNFEAALSGEDGPLFMGSAIFLVPRNPNAPYTSMLHEVRSKRYGDKSHQWVDLFAKRMEYGASYTHKRKVYVTNQNIRGEDLVSSLEKNTHYCLTFSFNGEVYKVGDDCFRITTHEGSSWMFKLQNADRIICRTGEKKLLIKAKVVNEDEDYSAPPLKWEMQKLSLK